MDQLDTLLILKEKFEADMKELGPDPTTKLEKVIKGNAVLNWLNQTI